uniref:Uncharacterized protein n=1 Tax=Cacopsylla melanoneura TaxID=428564 RepID=A0A8D8XL00_9HEMI
MKPVVLVLGIVIVVLRIVVKVLVVRLVVVVFVALVLVVVVVVVVGIAGNVFTKMLRRETRSFLGITRRFTTETGFFTRTSFGITITIGTIFVPNVRFTGRTSCSISRIESFTGRTSNI